MSAQRQVTVTIDADVYDRLLQLMAPPVSDVSSAIRALLYREGGRDSAAAIALAASERHFSYAEELERASSGVYEGGGAT